MLDTNTFDYIYDNGLTNKVQKAIDDEKLQLFATDVQKQEIEKVSNNARKQGIKQTAEGIRVKFMGTSAMIVALDQQGKKGYNGSRVGSRIASEEDTQLLETLKKVDMKHPLKNSADLLIFYTAIKENMDYLVTDNTDDFGKPLELFKVERGTKLQIIHNIDLEKLL
jgi:predicted nucleic acid-binding protein